MKVLAIDTSGSAISVAAADTGQLLSHFWLKHGKTHAEALMPCIQATLAGLSMQLSDFDAFAAISGPGSFTGLRIGIATIKAIAFANGSLVVGIPTHDALAFNLSGYSDSLLCPIMDARNGRVYQALYRSGVCNKAPTVRLADTQMLDVGAAVDRLCSSLKCNPDITRIIFNGDAADKYIEVFAGSLAGFPCYLSAERELYQSADSAALLACEAAERGLLITPDVLAPDYYNAGYMSK